MLTKSIGYIKMIKFTQKTVEEFKNTYNSLTAAGMQSLVLDLRGNNGGVFNAATGLSTLFLDEGNLISYTDGVISEREDHICATRGAYADGKIVLLTDGVTASSSEVFAGSMQDWDRALIIGSPTFGKGLIQQSYGFSDSSAIRLTISKYYRPTGRAVQNPSNEALVFPSAVTVGSETKQYMSAGYASSTMSGREIYSLGAGVSPDVFYPTEWYDGTDVPYKYIAEYFFKNQAELTQKHYNLHGLLASSSIDNYIKQDDPDIDDRDLAEVKAWLAALILGKDAYYETIANHDKVIVEAIKRMEDGTFDRLGVRY
jgi:carboxyl-terminal processing protease